MNMKRLFYGKPIREETTGSFWDEKIPIDNFCDDVERSIANFRKNMKSLKVTDKYPEEWMETLASWMEIEQER